MHMRSELCCDSLADVLSSPEPEILAGIAERHVALCIWERPVQPQVAVFLARFVESGAPLEVDAVVETGESVGDDPLLREQFCGHLSDPALALLLEDIGRLVELFRGASGMERVRVRLTRVVDAACAAFHVDSLPLRMLCTYHGDGMQWVPDDAACRRQLGIRGRSLRRANAAIVPDPARIETLPRWHAGIFKGRTHPEGGALALIHRSAPQCCERHPRIRLVLDVDGAGNGC